MCSKLYCYYEYGLQLVWVSLYSRNVITPYIRAVTRPSQFAMLPPRIAERTSEYLRQSTIDLSTTEYGVNRLTVGE